MNKPIVIAIVITIAITTVLSILWYINLSTHSSSTSQTPYNYSSSDILSTDNAGAYIDDRHEKCNFCCTGGMNGDHIEIEKLKKDPKYCDQYNKYHLTSCGIRTEECERDVSCLKDCFNTRGGLTEDNIKICTNEICG